MGIVHMTKKDILGLKICEAMDIANDAEEDGRHVAAAFWREVAKKNGEELRKERQKEEK